jgi:hypothetical protein
MTRIVPLLLLAAAVDDAAIEAFRLGDVGQCMRCVLPSLARAFDLANRPDSAIATLERGLAIACTE